jgi:tryptophan-rich sensory protein
MSHLTAPEAAEDNMRHTFRIAWLVLVVVAAVGGTIVWGLGQKNGAATTLRTTPAILILACKGFEVAH